VSRLHATARIALHARNAMDFQVLVNHGVKVILMHTPARLAQVAQNLEYFQMVSARDGALCHWQACNATAVIAKDAANVTNIQIRVSLGALSQD